MPDMRAQTTSLPVLVRNKLRLLHDDTWSVINFLRYGSLNVHIHSFIHSFIHCRPAVSNTRSASHICHMEDIHHLRYATIGLLYLITSAAAVTVGQPASAEQS